MVQAPGPVRGAYKPEALHEVTVNISCCKVNQIKWPQIPKDTKWLQRDTKKCKTSITRKLLQRDVKRPQRDTGLCLFQSLDLVFMFEGRGALYMSAPRGPLSRNLSMVMGMLLLNYLKYDLKFLYCNLLLLIGHYIPAIN